MSQSQYDKNLSLFMWDMCMLSWLVRWIGWPVKSDICIQSPVKFLKMFYGKSIHENNLSLLMWDMCMLSSGWLCGLDLYPESCKKYKKCTWGTCRNMNKKIEKFCPEV